jgi:hypothetical protein
MNAAHFVYIPLCILLGVVFGWILGGRAARDAYLAELRRREQRGNPASTKGTKDTKDAKDTMGTKKVI